MLNPDYKVTKEGNIFVIKDFFKESIVNKIE